MSLIKDVNLIEICGAFRGLSPEGFGENDNYKKYKKICTQFTESYYCYVLKPDLEVNEVHLHGEGCVGLGVLGPWTNIFIKIWIQLRL